jgi:lipoprotein signal peptidase
MSRRFSPSNLFLGSLFVLAAFSFDQLTKTIIADIVMQPPRVIVITGFLNIILSYNEGVSSWQEELPETFSTEWNAARSPILSIFI